MLDSGRMEGKLRNIGFKGAYAVSNIGNLGGLAIVWREEIDFHLISSH